MFTLSILFVVTLDVVAILVADIDAVNLEQFHCSIEQTVNGLETRGLIIVKGRHVAFVA